MDVLSPAPRVEIMNAFDALPDRIRRAIAQADFPYHPCEIANRLTSGWRVDVVVRSIERRVSR
jgi:hypothetical protein